MDLIAIDIGNHNISLALFVKDQISETDHIAVTQPQRLAEVIAALRKKCGPQPLGARTVPVAVSSVNPPALQIVEQAVGKALDQNVLLIGRDFPLDMKVAVENPETVGSDRLLTAWAAYEVVEAAVVVADFGTATTIDCVNDSGIFLGGVIMPGLALAARSLHEHTAALPDVQPALPQGNYGANTVAAIQSGVYYSAIGALREMAERYATQLGRWPQVIVTGGFAKLIAQRCDFIDSVVPDLCLDGLFLAYRQFRTAAEAEQEL